MCVVSHAAGPVGNRSAAIRRASPHSVFEVLPSYFLQKFFSRSSMSPLIEPRQGRSSAAVNSRCTGSYLPAAPGLTRWINRCPDVVSLALMCRAVVAAGELGAADRSPQQIRRLEPTTLQQVFPNLLWTSSAMILLGRLQNRRS